MTHGYDITIPASTYNDFVESHKREKKMMKILIKIALKQNENDLVKTLETLQTWEVPFEAWQSGYIICSRDSFSNCI